MSNSAMLLHSFNALTLENPAAILDNVRKCLKDKTTIDADYINESKGNRFRGTYEEQSSEESVKRDLAVSVGIKGKFGVYSGSVQVDKTHSSSRTITTFHSGYSSVLDLGTVTFNTGDADVIFPMLKPELVAALLGITDLAQAQRFTTLWGTHLITGLGLGGSLFVSTQANTSSLEEKDKLSVEVAAKYKSVSSVSAVAKVVQEVSQLTTSKSVFQSIAATGGSAIVASSIDAKDSTTFAEWAKTCTPDTPCNVSASIEFYELLKPGTARSMLKRYVGLMMVARSIANPTLFSKSEKAVAFAQNQVTAKADMAGFKIVGGGSAMTHGSTNFLVGSFPQLDSSGKPVAWNTTTHDVINPSADADRIVSFAFGIFDPDNYLELKCVTKPGTNNGGGADAAVAELPHDSVMTCGGVRFDNRGGASKFVLSSYPWAQDNYGWLVEGRDYATGASNVQLTAYAIGIKSTDADLVIKGGFVEGPMSPGQHGSSRAESENPICGGGLFTMLLSGAGSLVQGSFPDTNKSWQEYNDDGFGNVSQARGHAYGMYATATVRGLLNVGA